MKNVKISVGYYLVSQPINTGVAVQVTKKTNHIIVIDCSGSMSWQLQFIRTQLKNKLTNLMNEGDTITIIWFSGSRDAGILVEEVEVKSLKTLQDLNTAIDRWLKPVGMTAFFKPLVLAKEAIGRISAHRPNSVFSLMFLTDGYNNDCPWNDVKDALKALENDIASSTFVEYGYYADSQKLTEMAAIMGGQKISCDGFDDYEPVFDKMISKNYGGGQKIVVNLPNGSSSDFAFSVGDDGSILLYNIISDSESSLHLKVMVDSSVKEIYYFTTTPLGDVEQNIPLTAMYAATYVLSDKLLNDDAEKIVAAIGDNYYYKMLSNAFGKQKLNAFKSSIKECVTDISKRFLNGKGTVVIDDNAYCLMNLIDDLGSMEDCLFFPGHESWNYKRIGRQRVAVGSKLTEKDHEKLSTATNAAEMLKVAQELAENKIDLEFTNTNPNRGYHLNSLIWNKERANLSVLCKIDGIAKLPKNKFGIDEIATYKYNTYTLIKDGILNVTLLPVNWSPELSELLTKNGVKFTCDYDKTTLAPSYLVIDLASIPIINRGMVKGISAVELAKQEWQLIKIQAMDKVYKYYRTALFPKESKGFIEMLGQETADWLKEIGITDYNGFAPKVEMVESTDFYMSVNLITKIKGLSSLPKVEDVIAKMKDAKAVLKPAEFLMANAIKDFTLQLESAIYKALPTDQQEEVLRTYLVGKTDELNKLRRNALREIAKIKFSLILSKKWFLEFKTFEENKLNINLDGQNLDITFDLCEKEEKI